MHTEHYNYTWGQYMCIRTEFVHYREKALTQCQCCEYVVAALPSALTIG